MLKKLVKGLLILLALLLLAAIAMVATAEWQWRTRSPMANPPQAAAPAGDGPVLILLHGAGLNGRMWDAVRRDLDPRWRVIAPDLPGHGARLSEAYTLETATAAVKQAAQAVYPSPVILVGDSLGGYTAMAAASALPQQQLRGLILGGASGNFEPSEVINYVGNVVMVKTLLAFVDEQELLVKAMDKFGFAPADAKPVIATGGSIRVVPVAVRSMMGEDFKQRLAAITQPVLIVNGSEDTRAIAKETSFIAGLPRAPEVRHFENTGHGVSIRSPKQFAALVNEFAAQVTRP
ncbi:alpha/beta hydrolase [Pelomonas sp. SE-A7]|uniref:alpha/beta fold hydrolase n=1 Tax=Pelomonas sp. SE-A7 TaxID=3054953 RepID=UPI00259CA728|nr:alpha/beta hydrolase [Pelomonas sp. SE-A7]MDM4766312.1 alpha/beta hydrolase [Pelomonas sp. SE-A7]